MSRELRVLAVFREESFALGDRPKFFSLMKNFFIYRAKTRGSKLVARSY